MTDEDHDQPITTEDRRHRTGAQRLLAISGIIAPLFYAGLVITLGSLEVGFSHRTDMMSLLGGVGGVRGLAFNLSAGLTGFLLMAFAAGLHRGIGMGRGSRAGPLLIALGATGMVSAAIFHCDPACANVISRTPTGILHVVSAFVTGASLALAPFAILPRLGKHPRWADYRWFTVASGILANIPGLLLWGSFLTTRISAWEGLIQRLGIAFPLLWVEVTAIRLLWLSLRGNTGRSG